MSFCVACFDPYLRFPSGVDQEGQTKYTLKKLEKLDGDLYLDVSDNDNVRSGEFQIIPCGRCLGCRTSRSRDWANRLMIESENWQESWFVTLTFNDEMLERACGKEYTLRVEHLQKFMKRLRRDRPHMKFFACGEYGSKSMRPHYHLIIFGLHLDPLQLTWLKANDLNQDYYSSAEIAKYWSDPVTGESYGFNVCGSVTWSSCSYVARYVMKKAYGQDGLVYEKLGIKPPFLLMSRNPGIATDFMKSHDWANEPLIYLSSQVGSMNIPAPKYFMRYLKEQDSGLYEVLSQLRREAAQDSMEAKLCQTDKTYYQFVKAVEANVEKSLEVLTKRDAV